MISIKQLIKIEVIYFFCYKIDNHGFIISSISGFFKLIVIVVRRKPYIPKYSIQVLGDVCFPSDILVERQ